MGRLPIRAHPVRRQPRIVVPPSSPKSDGKHRPLPSRETPRLLTSMLDSPANFRSEKLNSPAPCRCESATRRVKAGRSPVFISNTLDDSRGESWPTHSSPGPRPTQPGAPMAGCPATSPATRDDRPPLTTQCAERAASNARRASSWRCKRISVNAMSADTSASGPAPLARSSIPRVAS